MGRKGLDTVMAALAGITLMASSAAATAPVEVVRQVRSLSGVEAPAPLIPPELLRARLAADPRLPRLLESLRRRVGQGNSEREDALSAVLLRIWERRPELLERSEGELRRYLDAAVRNESCDRARRNRSISLDEDLLGAPSEEESDVLDLEAQDLIDAIAARIPPLDRMILNQLVVDGASERSVADREGLSRHRVREGLLRIRSAAEEVLAF